MADKIINLVPSDLKQPRVSPAPSAPVPSLRIPNFNPPRNVVTDGFWSNLRHFLTERPAKVNPNFRSSLMPASFGGSVSDNLKDFFRSAPAPKGPVDSRLAINWGGNFGGFGQRIRELFFPVKQAPLPFQVKAVKVKEIWSKDENFHWTQAASVGLHAAVMALLILPLFFRPTPVAKAAVDVTPLEISPYIAKLPAGTKQAGGGGGGGDRSVTPPTRGRAPKFEMTQFTPPTAVIKNPAPKLPADPSLLGPPDLKISNPAMANYGDPLAVSANLSNGQGGGGGIGTGGLGGIGSGTGAGLGPGNGAGTGGGDFRAGLNGVGTPACIYCPDPEYSDEARKAKYQGTVLLDVVVTADGRVMDPNVIKGPGLGLEEKALQAVRSWRLKPALGPNGRPVSCRVQIEVTFRLY